MIHEIQKLLQSVDKYAILTTESHLLIMIKGYSPFCDCSLDSYYLTSNHLYSTSRQIANTIVESGHYARIANDLSFRSLVYETGLATIKGINSMAINEQLGSYFCINVVQTDADLSELGNCSSGGCKPEWCINCQVCVSNCPNGAIGSDGSFDASKCIRAYMNGQALTRDMFDKIGTRFLGCDDCQNICPHNKYIARHSTPEYIKQAVDNALYDYKALKPILGANYARPRIVFGNAIVVAGNSRDVRHLSRIQELSKDTVYSVNANIAIDKINGE